MQRFVCRHCGFVIENPEISVDGMTMGWFREVGVNSEDEGKSGDYATGVDTHHFHIECPVCLHRTDFTRSEPFPTDKQEG